LYQYRFTDRIDKAVSSYQSEQLLFENVTSRVPPMVVDHQTLFWMNRNAATAFSRHGIRSEAIRCMDQALTIFERDPSVFSNKQQLLAHYAQLAQWMRQEGREAEAKQVEDRSGHSFSD
jgi:hypothetical protein